MAIEMIQLRRMLAIDSNQNMGTFTVHVVSSEEVITKKFIETRNWQERSHGFSHADLYEKGSCFCYDQMVTGSVLLLIPTMICLPLVVVNIVISYPLLLNAPKM